MSTFKAILGVLLLAAVVIGLVVVYLNIAPELDLPLPRLFTVSNQPPQVRNTNQKLYPTIPVEDVPFGFAENPLATIQGTEAPTLMSVFGKDPDRADDYFKQIQPEWTSNTITAALSERCGSDAQRDVIHVWVLGDIEYTRWEVNSTARAIVAVGFTPKAVTHDLKIKVVDNDNIDAVSTIEPCLTAAGVPPSLTEKKFKSGVQSELTNDTNSLALLIYDTVQMNQLADDNAVDEAFGRIFEGDSLFQIFASSITATSGVWTDPSTGKSYDAAYPIVETIVNDEVCKYIQKNGLSCDGVNINLTVEPVKPNNWYVCGTGKVFYPPP